MQTQINNLIEKYQSEIKVLENNNQISQNSKTQIIATLKEVIFDLENEIKKGKR